MAVSWPADARAQSQAIEFDIPSQPIATALVAFARQANVRLVMSEEPSGGVAANAVRGALDRERALEQLLEGTGYEGRFEDGAIRLWRVFEGRETERGAYDARDAEMGRLAQAGIQQPGARDGPDLGGRAREEEIVVVGTNIRGIYPSSSPVDIYTANDMSRTAAVTTEQFIAKLPQNLGTRTQFAVDSSPARNLEGVNAVDLRGLGVGATLTLLNGRRLALSNFGQATDISLIPMSAIERVEVLTDGASAIYGSDAVGGVVNFVLRRNFEGAQTGLSYGGVTSGGLRQLNASQIFGTDWHSGSALFSYDYLDASPLLRTDRSYSNAAGPGTTLAGLVEPTLTPDDTRHGILATLSQRIGNRVSLNADIVLSNREVENATAATLSANPALHSFTTFRSEAEQYFANLELEYEFAEALNVSVLATYSNVDVDSATVRTVPARSTATHLMHDTNYAALDLGAKVDGSLPARLAGAVRFSFGAGLLQENYQGARTSAGLPSGRDLGRATTYAFGEFFLPLVASEQGVPFVHKLELSLAARYTKYADESEPSLNREFGDRTSPKIGLLWAPSDDFRIRGTYGESFRAPSLTEIDPSSATTILDPFLVDGEFSAVIYMQGPSPELEPETASSYTLGFDFRPPSYRGFQLSATYFKIDYAGRLAFGDPTFGVAASSDPSAFPQVIFRPESAAQIEEFLRYTPNILNGVGVDLSDLRLASVALFEQSDLWIIDNRLRNLARSALDGLDVSIKSRVDLSFGEMSVEGQVTRIFSYEQQLLPSSAPLSVVDTVLLPVDLRARFSAGFSGDELSTTVSVNYIDDYSNPHSLEGAQSVDSWVTVDWNMTFDFASSRGVFKGLRIGLSAQNVFDEDPPFVARSAGQALVSPVGFDPANANPLGRFVVASISKAW